MTCENVAESWASRAESLAEWAWRRLVNRTNAWGQYRAPGEAPYVRKEELTQKILERHFRGADVSDLIGLHTTSPSNTSRWLALDVDQHGSDEEAAHRHETALMALYAELAEAGCCLLLSDSDGKGSFHLHILLAEPAETERVYETGQRIVRRLAGMQVGSAELFPKQPRLPDGGFGNWLRLPGCYHTRVTGHDSGMARNGQVAQPPSTSCWRRPEARGHSGLPIRPRACQSPFSSVGRRFFAAAD